MIPKLLAGSCVTLVIVAAAFAFFADRGKIREPVRVLATDAFEPEIPVDTGPRESDSAEPPAGMAAGNATPSAASLPRFFQGDQYTLAWNALPAARSGDPQSQYLVWRVLELCRENFQYFSRYSMYEAIARTRESYPGRLAELTERYEQCGTFYEKGFDDFDGTTGYLEAAADGGNPEAMLALAKVLLSQKGEERDAERVKELIVGALATGSPETLMGATVLSSPAYGIVDQSTAVALGFAACELGLDCSSDGDAMRRTCRSRPECGPGETFQSLMFRLLDRTAYEAARAEAEAIRGELMRHELDDSRFNWSILSR